MIALRIVKALLVATVGVWAALVAYGNVADYGSNWAFVQHVLAMDTVFADKPLKSRAVTDPGAQRIAYTMGDIDELRCLADIEGAFGRQGTVDHLHDASGSRAHHHDAG